MPEPESSQPANSVSPSGTGIANWPATRNTSKPSAYSAPTPLNSSGTQVRVSPFSSSACHSGGFQLSFLALLIVWGSQRSPKIFAVVSTIILSDSDITVAFLSKTLVAEYLRLRLRPVFCMLHKPISYVTRNSSAIYRDHGVSERS